MSGHETQVALDEERRRAEMVALVTSLSLPSALTEAEEGVVLAFVCGLARGQLRGKRSIKLTTHKTHVNRICRKTGYRSLCDLRDALLRRFFGLDTSSS